MDTRGREYFLGAMKKLNNYESKVATSIFFTITERVKFELYSLIEREIGKKRKNFFIPQYPNEFEQNEILILLMKIPLHLHLIKLKTSNQMKKQIK